MCTERKCVRKRMDVWEMRRRGEEGGEEGRGLGCVLLRVKVVAHNEVLRQRMASVHMCTHEHLLQRVGIQPLDTQSAC